MAKREDNGHVHATCLNENRGDEPRATAPHEHGERRVYTDGSMDPKKQNARAGCGIATYEVSVERPRKFPQREVRESRNVTKEDDVPGGRQAQ